MIMRTIEVNLYEFDELSSEAKSRALENHDVNTDYIYDDAQQTVKAFNELFGTKEGSDSWLDIRTGHIDDCILELSGFRLQKYIWNNFGSSLFKNKYLKHGELSDVRKPFHNMIKQHQITENCPNKGKFSISYYSNIHKDTSCVLTGVCYDHSILEPIYSFLNARDFKNQPKDFEYLLEKCMASLGESIEDEVNYRNSDESKIEDIKSGSLEFTECGIPA